jgi:hypothetical protein
MTIAEMITLGFAKSALGRLEADFKTLLTDMQSGRVDREKFRNRLAELLEQQKQISGLLDAALSIPSGEPRDSLPN